MRIKRAWSHLSYLNVAGETVTVITRRYIAVLKRFLRALNSKCAGTLNQQSFQEDGPVTHTRTSRDNLAWLQDRFKERLFLHLRLRELATMFAGFHRSGFFLWDTWRVLCTRGHQKPWELWNRRSLRSFARFTQPNVWPRKPDAEHCSVAKKYRHFEHVP